ncbi:MAG TPA: acyl-CoA dehydrogenase [Spirochaetota bacterium]|nr:acyl-CoA dehydrogenase [Spirochaetota bacterium]
MSDQVKKFQSIMKSVDVLRKKLSEEDAIQSIPDISERTLFFYGKLAGTNLQSMLIGKELGGEGLTYSQSGVVLESLSYDLIGALPSLITTLHCVELIKLAPGSEQKENLLHQVMNDHRPLAFCLTEEDAGSDIGGIKCTALQTKKDIRLRGNKSVVINSTVAQMYLVFATTARDRGRAGINVFAVKPGTEGVSIDAPYTLDGFQNSVIGSVEFKNVSLAQGNRLSGEGTGYFQLIEVLDKGRPLVAASCVGAAQKVMDTIVHYTKKRSQFNMPLNHFQGITFPLAEYATRLHAARLLYRDALKKIDDGDLFTMEASMAKHYASMLLEDLASFGMEVLGYRGMAQQNPVKRIYHDAQLLKSIDGTANVQRMIIASQL